MILTQMVNQSFIIEAGFDELFPWDFTISIDIHVAKCLHSLV